MTSKEMEKFEEEMIKFVNKHADIAAKSREQIVNEKQQNLSNPTVKQKYETVAQKSIKKAPTKTNTSKATDKKVNPAKVAIITCILVALIALGIQATLSANMLFSDKIIAAQEAKRSIEVLKTKAKMKLLYYNLAGLESETNDVEIKNNTVDDYRLLDVNDPIDVYIYRKILPTKEFDKFIQAVTYTESYSDTIREYTDIDQFLRINGYCYKDRDLRIPSEEIFENYMEAYIKDNYKKILEEYEYTSQNVSYTFEQSISGYESPTGKGGR